MARNAAKQLDHTKALTTTRGGEVRSRLLPRSADRALTAVMRTNRPLVTAHLSAIKNAHPALSGDALVAELERRYLLTITASGAAAGATAALPVIGTITALGVSVAETVAFFEATALFGQSVAEVHGLIAADPARSRALVLALLLGSEGAAILQQWGAETLHKDASRGNYWEQLVSAQLPGLVVSTLLNRLRKRVLRRFATRESTGIMLRILPCGIGAIFGGYGNRVLGHRVVEAARAAFGPVSSSPNPGRTHS